MVDNLDNWKLQRDNFCGSPCVLLLKGISFFTVFMFIVLFFYVPNLFFFLYLPSISFTLLNLSKVAGSWMFKVTNQRHSKIFYVNIIK